MCILCPDKPPQGGATSKNQGAMQNQMIGYQNNPNTFQVDLKNACCADPLCCCVGGLGSICGFSACWARKTVLETKLKGIDDFICFQGYLRGCGPCKERPPSSSPAPLLTPHTCSPLAHTPHSALNLTPLQPPTCAGSPLGLCLEGCCCPVMSISIARIHIMDLQQLQPDPMDYQIIQCSNFLQLVSCICNIIAIFVEELREAAAILDCIADMFTLSVAGCMIAQLNQEIKYIKSTAAGGNPSFVVAQPVVMGQNVGAPPKGEEMER